MSVGKMRGHPVEKHGDPSLMSAVYETHQPFRLAEAGRRREQADGLVTPGRIEGMFGDRQQFDMGEAHAGDIWDGWSANSS